MRNAFSVKIILIICLFGVNVLLLVHGWSHLFAREKAVCQFDPGQVENDIDFMKYRISFASECMHIDVIDVWFEGNVTPETLAVERVLYDGSRKFTKIRRVEIRSDNHIAIELDEQRVVMADGTTKYDICFDKKDNVRLDEVTADVSSNHWLGLGILLIIWVGTLFSGWRFRRQQEEYTGFVTAVILIFAMAVVVFVCVEFLGNKEMAKMSQSNIVRNIVLLMLIGAVTSIALNSIRNGLIVCVTGMGILGIVNHYLLLFRAKPLQPSDAFSVRTALSVAGYYDYRIDRHLIYSVSFMLAFIAVFAGFGRLKIFRKIKSALVGLCAAAILIITFFLLTYCTELNVLIPKPSYWNVNETYDASGFLPSFISYGRVLIKPNIGYTGSKAENAMRRVIVGEEKILENEKPNIIVIMNEALADYRHIGEFEISDSPWKYWDSLKGESLTGYLKVPVYGGGTANTEYEFLTGHSLGLFNGEGVPYTMYSRYLNYSIASVLKAQGYETVAMHPNKASNYNRDKIYPAIGFETFLSSDNFFSDAHRLRGVVSDYGDYSSMLDWITERSDDRPYFIFNITMQNHSDYISNTIPIECYLKADEFADVNEYMTLLNRSDQALEYLIESLRGQSEKIVVVIFGDHFPDLSEKFVESLTNEEEGADDNMPQRWKTYEVPVLIWANYHMTETVHSDLYMSVNYLGSYLMNTLGLRLSPYESFLLDLKEKYPVIAADAYLTGDGSYCSADGIRSLPSDLYDYYLMQYGQIFHDKNREFFIGKPAGS